MPERSDDLLLTFAELGERLGVSPDGARMRAKREGWPVERGNDSRAPARVRVPVDALPEHPPERRSKSDGNASEFDERMAELAASMAELRAAFDRTREIEVELRGELADTRTRAAVAEARLEAERSGSQALIAELRQQIEDARRPWWRRLAG
jgi:hypothetical protein